jgi:hypothetical protein
MRGASNQTVGDSAFARYLRSGRHVPDRPGDGAIELKFNPNHDPGDGRFTSGPGGGQAEPRAPESSGSRRTGRATRSDDGARLGILSERHETSGRGPGTVSTGKGDAGGVSYGSYQLATNTGDAAAFMASDAAKPWARDFKGLVPGTAAFTERWKGVARRDAQAFGAAQHAYVQESHYAPVVRRVEQATSYDLDGASDAVRNVTWSIAVQHGHAANILADAVRQTDRTVARSNPRYEEALINNAYAGRSAYVRHLRERQLAIGKRDQASQSADILKNRYPQELADALDMLRKERGQ